MEMICRYLTGPRFRHQIEAVFEGFAEMQAELDRERKAMTRLWANGKGRSVARSSPWSGSGARRTTRLGPAVAVRPDLSSSCDTHGTVAP
jgi:hypothetical protein